MCGQLRIIHAADILGQKRLSAALQDGLGLCKGLWSLIWRGGGGVLDAPMGPQRGTGPDRACFPRSRAANRDHRGHPGGPLCGKFIPALGAETGNIVAFGRQQGKGLRMHPARRLAACRIGGHTPLAQMVQQGFQQDRAGRITGA
jgi:hypothetical protein